MRAATWAQHRFPLLIPSTLHQLHHHSFRCIAIVSQSVYARQQHSLQQPNGSDSPQPREQNRVELQALWPAAKKSSQDNKSSYSTVYDCPPGNTAAMDAPVPAEATLTNPQKPPIKKRQVVSSFILKDPFPGVNEKPMIALFLRSEKVSTYRNRLGAISGTIDAEDTSPVSAAWRELKEETCLGPDQVTLVRKGKPYTFGDTNLNREWTIHAFLYKLKHPSLSSKIRIDWEHTDFEWLDPMTVPDEDERIVPRIAESLRRVYVERDLGSKAGRTLETGLQTLQNDHVNGARVLAGTALATLIKIAETMDSHIPASRWWYNLRMAGWHLWRNGRPAMDAAIRAVVVEALTRVEGIAVSAVESKPMTGDLHGKIISTLQTYQEERVRAVDKVSQAFVSYLTDLSDKIGKSGEVPRPISILTLSASSTIIQSITQAARVMPLDIRVLESRPLFEGVSAAASFAALPQTTVTVYPDAAVGYAARGADMVLLGADRISETGAVSNKIGSLPAVLTAKHVSKEIKVVVLGESEKVASGEGVEEENAAAEIVDAWRTSGPPSASSVVEAVMAGASAGSGGGHDDGDGSTGRRDEKLHDQGVTGSSDKEVAEELGSQTKQQHQAAAREKTGRVEVRNLYFEWVQPPDDMQWIYLSERGRWDAKDIAIRAREVDGLAEKLFLDL
ncbi:hypothetical protein MKZ38_006012 [Zalerion maritima]|uniref:Nudix hydrolase domain-containing protein n=1 Tax=Zalerion maritima TaxID=339359 RepID=A0AAD5RPI3_9PEZI|nr:hypothetical protein MKZ38_006012 [Zalerion maritima]